MSLAYSPGRATGISDGIVGELWRFPVKSMGGERLDEAIITDQGVLGDRAVALFDLETNAVVSASNKHFQGLLDCSAAFIAPPRVDADLPPVRITLPDGTSCSTDLPDSGARLSAWFGRDVTLVHTKPDSYSRKQAAFFAGVGLECSSPAGSIVDLSPVSVISTATLLALSGAHPESRFEPRRFRMNVIVTGTAAGLVENTWVGRHLALGKETRVAVTMPDPRCVMTTLSQGDLPKDPVILRAVAELNSLAVGSGGPLPCAGVYATVVQSGVVRTQDPAVLFAA